MRTPDGFSSAVHQTAARIPNAEPKAYRVPFVNPATNRNNLGAVRLINPTSTANRVRIEAWDDRGEPGEGVVTLELAPRAGATLTSVALEDGDPERFQGAFGDGAGKWWIRVESADHRGLFVMGLVHKHDGSVRNVSR